MYKYKINKQVQKFLESQSKDFLIVFSEKLTILVNDPYNNNLDIKSLRGLEKNYRLRIGKYRFLYIIQDNELYIYFFKAGSRGDIYKK